MSTLPIDRVRVLVLIKGLGVGGAEALIAEAAPLWDRDTFDYRVCFMLPWKDQLVTTIRDVGVDVTPLDWVGPPGLAAAARWRKLIDVWRPDIVHSHLPAAGLLARLATPKQRHVYTEHNIVSSYRPVTRLLNRATYGRNSAVVAVSGAVADSLRGYPGPAHRVIPNGVAVSVPEEETVRVRIELGLSLDQPLVVHVGNIRPHKGHATLIHAATILMAQRPDVVFVSIGGEKYTGDLDRVRALAAASGVGDRIRFLGRREDARSFLAAADVVVNPADVEGLPLVVLEALALGRPVVATAVGGVPSVVRNEETGLLVSPRNPEQLAGALAYALESKSSQDWGQKGARLVKREYGLESMVRSYEKLYREVMDGPAQHPPRHG